MRNKYFIIMLTEQEFIKKAITQIPDNPKDRLTKLTQEALKKPHVVFDTHCHIFDRKCISVLYFILRSIGLKKESFNPIKIRKKTPMFFEKTEDEIYALVSQGDSNNDDVQWDQLISDYQQFQQDIKNNPQLAESPQQNFGYGIGGIVETLLMLLKGSMKDVLEHYLNNYALHKNAIPELDGAEIITAVIMMDIEKSWDITVKKSQRDQIDEIKQLTQDFAILPYLSIDPRRYSDVNNNIFDLFLHAFSNDDKSFFGVKVYPALGYSPTDERLRAIYEVCEKKGIPVLSHCGGEVVSTYQKSVNGVKFSANGRSDYQFTSNNRRDLAQQLNDPALWKDVLEVFPNLRLNLGHHGGGNEWTLLGQGDATPRLQIIANLMATYPNVFADFSFNLIDRTPTNAYLNAYKIDEIIRERGMFGTDYWVVLPSGDLVKEQKHFLGTINQMGFLNKFVTDTPRKYFGI